MKEISSIDDVCRLAMHGFNRWADLGDVAVKSCGDLLLFNYTPAAQYAGRWNAFERMSRGLILNRSTGEVVARPFDKFFNWGENGRSTDAPLVAVHEKLDGSLGTLYRENGYRIATRGSFDSPQAGWATRFLNEHHDLSGLEEHWTLLFEIIYPENQVIVDYGNRETLVLLAARDRKTGKYMYHRELYDFGQEYGFPTPQSFELEFGSVDDIVARLPELPVNEEGYVAEFADGQRFKFKGDQYRELHRLVCGLSFNAVLGAVIDGTVLELFERIPDEFTDDARAWLTEIVWTRSRTLSAVRRAFAAAPKGSRKEFALWVQQKHPELAPYLFAMLDGRDVAPLVYKLAFKSRKEKGDG